MVQVNSKKGSKHQMIHAYDSLTLDVDFYLDNQKFFETMKEANKKTAYLQKEMAISNNQERLERSVFYQRDLSYGFES